jgi:peroxiredoxin
MKKSIIIFIVIGVIVVGGVIALSFVSTGPASDAGELVVGTKEGNLAPDFQVQTIDGQNISLGDFRGEKALLITSTASWCPTCIIEANNISPVYPQFRDRVEFLSVSIDPSDDRLKLEELSANTNSPWFYTEPNLPGVTDMIISYKLTRFEITYVIDKDGVIVFKDTGITSTDTLTEVLAGLK